MSPPSHLPLSRRELLKLSAGSATTMALPAVVAAAEPDRTGARAPELMQVDFEVNGTARSLRLDTRVTLLDLGVRLVSISAWIPRRRYSHWMRCPSCHQHTWCEIGWND